MTATIVHFDGSDEVAAKSQLETLAPATTDVVIRWTIGSTVYVAKVK